MTSQRVAWALMAPMIMLIVFFAGYPVARILFLSFFEQNLSTDLMPRFSGADNYLRVLGDGHFFQTLKTTLIFTITAVSLELLLGLGAAMALHHAPFAKGLSRTLALVPWVLPTSALALAWIWIFNDQFGVVNELLIESGILREGLAWLGASHTAFAALVFADVWKTTPFIMLLLLAGLQTIPSQLYEAAAIDGATALQSFWSLTLPLLRPVMMIAVLFRSLQSFGIFDLVYVMTGGGPGGATETVALYTYRNLMRYLDFGYGAALLVVTALCLAALSVAIWILFGGRSANS